MESIFVLLPIALVLLVVIVAVFFWAVRSGQFEDMDGPAYSILFDDDQPESARQPAVDKSASGRKTESGQT